MIKLALLDIVQKIMSDYDADEVNSINDTVESIQVATCVADTFAHIIDGRDWPHLNTLFQLNSYTDVDHPTYLLIPETISEVTSIRYNKRTLTDTKDKIEPVTYKTPEEFLTILNQRNSTDTNIDSITDTSDITFLIKTDQAPSYWTSFDDNIVIFDSYDSEVDSVIQNSKTQCFGKRIPVFTLDDDFVPDLPGQAFSYLLAEAKSAASLILRQQPDNKAQERSVTQRRRMSQKAWKVNGGIQYPNYGRKR